MTRERFVAQPGCAVWTGAVLIIVVALMAAFVPAEPLPIDQAWSDAMQDIQSEALRNVALAFNWLGRGLGIALTVSAVAVALIRTHRWLALVSFGVVESLAPLSSSLLKALVGRARPPDGAIYPHGTSFPSGHTTYAGATCVALVLLFTRLESRRLWWSLASLGIAGMAWSRTYLQVHWLSDVIAGALLGIGIALLVFGAAQQWSARLLRIATHPRRVTTPPANAAVIDPWRPRRRNGSPGVEED